MQTLKSAILTTVLCAFMIAPMLAQTKKGGNWTSLFKSKKLILAENLQQGGGRFWEGSHHTFKTKQHTFKTNSTKTRTRRSALPIVR